MATPPPPPPALSVGPNFSHHKARVHAMGWFPFGDQQTGQHTFCHPPPPNRSGTEWVTDPTQPPPPAPRHVLCTLAAGWHILSEVPPPKLVRYSN